MKALYRLENVRKVYNNFYNDSLALNDINLDIMEGEIVEEIINEKRIKTSDISWV